ncbi:hypothetical protein ACOME3_002167 [Neoechinorhynchus agilis]
MTKSGLPLSKACQDLINDQITAEFAASYAYEQMALYCLRYDVALKNFAEHFRKESDEEIRHARKFIDYMVLRNGHFEPKPIPNLVKYNEFKGIVHLFEIAYQLEEDVTKMIKGSFVLNMDQIDRMRFKTPLLYQRLLP